MLIWFNCVFSEFSSVFEGLGYYVDIAVWKSGVGEHYLFIYYYFNMQYYTVFLLFQNSLFSQYKKWKIEKIQFFCACCVHTQNFLRDKSLMLCCSPKFFSWFFETFLVLKIVAKKNFCRKKGRTTEISKRKKKMKNGRFLPIGRDMGPIFWGSILVY